MQVPDFGRQAFYRRRHDSERREKHRVTVPGDDLGGDRLDRETEPAGDMRFDGGVDVGESPDRAGDRAYRDFLARGGEARAVPRELGVSLRQFQAEGRRLGVDPVAAPDARRAPVFARAAFERREQRVEVGEEEVRSARQLDREAGVEDIGRGHAAVHEPRFLADMLRHRCQERDDIVFDLSLNGVDAPDFETPPLGDHGRDAAGDRPQPLLRLAGVAFDIQPDSEPRLRRPDRGHCGPRIAGDHGVNAAPPPGCRRPP